MPQQVSSEWSRKKFVFFGVMVPAMVGIPLFLELCDIEAIYEDRASLVTQLLSGIDMLFFVYACYYYPFMKKLVTRIDYNIEEDKINVH